jgi:hypothetical protein
MTGIIFLANGCRRDLWAECGYFAQTPRAWSEALRGRVRQMIQEMCEESLARAGRGEMAGYSTPAEEWF